MTTFLGRALVHVVSLLCCCPAEFVNNWSHNDVDYGQNSEPYAPVEIKLAYQPLYVHDHRWRLLHGSGSNVPTVWLGFRPYRFYQGIFSSSEWPQTKRHPYLDQLHAELPLPPEPEVVAAPLVIPEFHGIFRPTQAPAKSSLIPAPFTLNQAVHHGPTRKPRPWRKKVAAPHTSIRPGSPNRPVRRYPWRAKPTKWSRLKPKRTSSGSPVRMVPALQKQRVNQTDASEAGPQASRQRVTKGSRPGDQKTFVNKNNPRGKPYFVPARPTGVNKAATELVLELAVFCDKECHDSFMPYFKSEDKLREAIFAVINQVQQYFRPPWLVEPINIFITHLEIHKRHDTSLLLSRDALTLLHNFSDYQMVINPPEGQVGHWDMALLLSGKALYITEKEEGKLQRAGVLGKAWVGGFCSSNYSTVVVEFGREGRVVPSLTAGIQASNVVAHEMAHNLGLFHDGPPKNEPCAGDHFIMAEWRSRDTTNKWSRCSKSTLDTFQTHPRADCLAPLTQQQLAATRHLNAWKDQPPPGQVIDADEQCQIFLKDHNARRAGKPEEIQEICTKLMCKSEKLLGYTSPGGALEGTYCGGTNWCRGSRCEPIPKEHLHVVPGGWSEWQVEGKCTKACLENSVPLIRMRRFCNNPPKKNSIEGCEGDSTVLRPCDINENKSAPKCTRPLTNKEYIDQKCEYFSRLKPDLKPDGLQLPYDRNQTWRACSIYCRYRNKGYIFAKYDLVDYPNETGYLPDGTRCNFDKDTGAAYYCQSNQCATLLQSLAGIQDNEEGVALDVDADDWAVDEAQGRTVVEKYLNYKPGGRFAVLDKKKIKHTPLRVHVDDAVEIPGT